MAQLDWNSEISNDGGDFKVLEPGTYPFTIKAIEKTYFNGSAKIPACPKAVVTLRVGQGAEASDVTDGLLLDDSLEWKLCQFFTAIGSRTHGQKLRMNWDDSYLIGKTGYVEIETRTYTKNDGTEGRANQVKAYIDPADMPTAKPAASAGTTW